MNFRYVAAALVCALVLASLSSRLEAREDRVPVVMHAHSTFTWNGMMPMEEIITLAAKNGIRGIIFTDHDLSKWEYGLPPLRNLLRRTIEKNSVLKTGPEAYLSRIRELNRKYPNMVAIPGVESTPFYFWSGSPLRNNLTLHNANKHLVIAGLSDAEQYRHLPIIGNEKAAGRIDLRLLLLPLSVIFFGSIVVYARKVIGTILILAGVALLANNYPFKALPYDQYHGDKGDRPYQQVIDYVNTVAPETGLVFWAHPEAVNFERGEKIGPVSVSTPKYVNSLVGTAGYTGFAYFREGSREAGKPGGTWDMLLTEYAAGKRSAPIWAAGESDFRKGKIDLIQNIVLLDEKPMLSAERILAAMKSGHFYVIQRPREAAYDLLLDRFEIRTTEGGAGMGGRLNTGGRHYAVLCDLRASDFGRHAVTVDVIKNGAIIETYRLASPLSLNIPGPENDEPAYYRIEITSDNGSRLITNPLFLE